MENILEVKNLCKSYGRKNVLNDISFTIAPGKIVGLLAPNGEGKTTLIKLIAGLITQNSGSITVCGKRIGRESKAIVSYMADRNVFADLTKVKEAIDNYEYFFADFDREKAERFIKQTSISLNDRVGKLSKGKTELLYMMLTLSRKAGLYVLDEPLANVDPAKREYIINTMLKEFNEDSSILISTHLIADVENVLDEVIILSNNKLLIHDTADNIRETNNCSLNEFFKKTFAINFDV